ncbi:MAG: gluconokinase [Candidatus Korobacteraceae bacterium]
MIIILMGVSGVGKTTIGRALAEELHWRFAEGDDFHSAANIAKMHAGTPLTDEDRAPWLQSLRDAITGWLASGENVVLACSALKASYRETLRVSSEVKFVYLHASFELIAQRLALRKGHYMNADLLRSQFDTLEEPKDVPTIDASLPVKQIVNEIRAALGV